MDKGERFTYDGCGINAEGGERLFTAARHPERDGGGYIQADEDRKRSGELLAAAGELADALEIILRANDTNNNGAIAGEAVLCPMFADQARAALKKAGRKVKAYR